MLVDVGIFVEWYVFDVDDKVVNLVEEVVLVGLLVVVVIFVGISVNYGYVFKVGGGFESWRVDGIIDYLGVVVGNDWFVDVVGVGREVYKIGSCGLRGVVEIIVVLVVDGFVDGFGIIGGVIVFGIVVLNIVEDFVVGRVGVEGSIILLFDGIELLVRFLVRGWGCNGR